MINNETKKYQHYVNASHLALFSDRIVFNKLRKSIVCETKIIVENSLIEVKSYKKAVARTGGELYLNEPMGVELNEIEDYFTDHVDGPIGPILHKINSTQKPKGSQNYFNISIEEYDYLIAYFSCLVLRHPKTISNDAWMYDFTANILGWDASKLEETIDSELFPGLKFGDLMKNEHMIKFNFMDRIKFLVENSHIMRGVKISILHSKQPVAINLSQPYIIKGGDWIFPLSKNKVVVLEGSNITGKVDNKICKVEVLEDLTKGNHGICEWLLNYEPLEESVWITSESDSEYFKALFKKRYLTGENYPVIFKWRVAKYTKNKQGFFCINEI